MTDMDPSQAASMAVNDHMEAEGMDPDGIPEPDVSPDSSTSNSVVDGLLETEPAGSVRDYPDLPEPAAHAMIGSIKFLNGLLGDDRSLGSGKPALVNFLEAGIGFVMESDDSDSPAPEPDHSSPAADVGGEISE
jgi:hypothetical protein